MVKRYKIIDHNNKICEAEYVCLSSCDLYVLVDLKGIGINYFKFVTSEKEIKKI